MPKPAWMALALSLAGVFYLLSLLHLVWIFRRPGPGSKVIPTADGKPLLTPGPVVTLLVAVALAAAGTLCLWRAGLLPWGLPEVPRGALWLLALAFVARAVGDFRYVGFFKRVRGTPFARYDTLFYSPLCLGIAAAAVALNVLAPVPG